MKQIRISYFLFLSLLRDGSESYARYISELLILAVRVTFLISVYSLLYKVKGEENFPESLKAICYSMSLYFVYMSIAPRNISREIQNDIKTGKTQDFIVKPYNYILQTAVRNFSRGFVNFLLTFIITLTFLLIYFGPISNFKNFFFYPVFLISFLLSYILSFLIYEVLGFLAFWLEDVKPLFWVIDKFMMILGGSYFPVALFPTFLKNIAKWSPFGASQFITSIVYSNWKSLYVELFLIQMSWIIIFSLLLYMIYRLAEKNVATNGG